MSNVTGICVVVKGENSKITVFSSTYDFVSATLRPTAASATAAVVNFEKVLENPRPTSCLRGNAETSERVGGRIFLIHPQNLEET